MKEQYAFGYGEREELVLFGGKKVPATRQMMCAWYLVGNGATLIARVYHSLN